MNGYDYSVDSGRIVKTMNSSFCTPLLWTFSGGLSVTWKNFGSLNLGMTSAKFTYIRDKSIFERQDVTTFYGVPQGKDHKIEFGLSMEFLADKDFLKRLHWNCDLLLFKNYAEAIDLTLKNNFGIKISKILKVTIQTQVYYEQLVSKCVQLQNLITFGLSVHI